ncbi:oligosaccharide flippase family protein [Eisenibacter elegans]|uniref:oligosaccharide flippase family protein n=1 Tax=Eisenibacter elegans TaxID=997 RepID=UPI000421BD84|nr:oligosaccharide flippase family protein [Eisenibacter elegans]
MSTDAPQGIQRVLQNFMALGLMQVANFLLPLLVIPYLTRVIGIELYGTVNWLHALMIYLAIFTDYGFQITATREVAVHRSNLAMISKIFYKILFTRIILCLTAGILLWVGVQTIPALQTERWAAYLGFSFVIGQALSPVWFFQGMERMFYITILTVIAKLLFTVLVFVLVQSPHDYVYVLFYQGLGWVVAGGLGTILAIRLFRLQWVRPSVQEVWEELYSGWGVFSTNLSVASYTTANLLLLGLWETDKQVVGYYSVAEKVVTALRQILVTFSQATYPRVCQLAQQSHSTLRVFYRRLHLPFVGLIAGGTILLWFLAPQVLWIVSGETSESMVMYLRLLIWIPLVVATNIPFYQTLLAYNLSKGYVRVVNAGFVLNLCLNALLLTYFSALGSSLSFLLTEIFISIALVIALERHNSSKSIVFVSHEFIRK